MIKGEYDFEFLLSRPYIKGQLRKKIEQEKLLTHEIRVLREASKLYENNGYNFIPNDSIDYSCYERVASYKDKYPKMKLVDIYKIVADEIPASESTIKTYYYKYKQKLNNKLKES
jgi:hypothetical protein